MSEEKTPLVATIEDLAASRGIGTLEELVERANAAPAEFDDEEPLTVEEIVVWPPTGFGNRLDAVLEFTEEERMRVVGAFTTTFFPEPRADR